MYKVILHKQSTQKFLKNKNKNVRLHLQAKHNMVHISNKLCTIKHSVTKLVSISLRQQPNWILQALTIPVFQQRLDTSSGQGLLQGSFDIH